MYKHMLDDLKARRDALDAEEDKLTKLVEVGSTQGLGAYLKEGHALMDEFDMHRHRVLQKEMLRSLPVEHLRHLYERVRRFTDSQGLPHPQSHPLTPAQLNKVGSTPLVEALTEKYNMRPRELIDDVFKRPDLYPPVESNDRPIFEAIRKYIQDQ